MVGVRPSPIRVTKVKLFSVRCRYFGHMGMPVPDPLVAAASTLFFVLVALQIALRRVEEILLSGLRLKRIAKALRDCPTDRRSGVERRVAQIPFGGQDRRSHRDRRSVTAAA